MPAQAGASTAFPSRSHGSRRCHDGVVAPVGHCFGQLVSGATAQAGRSNEACRLNGAGSVAHCCHIFAHMPHPHRLPGPVGRRWPGSYRIASTPRTTPMPPPVRTGPLISAVRFAVPGGHRFPARCCQVPDGWFRPREARARGVPNATRGCVTCLEEGRWKWREPHLPRWPCHLHGLRPPPTDRWRWVGQEIPKPGGGLLPTWRVPTWQVPLGRCRLAGDNLGPVGRCCGALPTPAPCGWPAIGAERPATPEPRSLRPSWCPAPARPNSNRWHRRQSGPAP